MSLSQKGLIIIYTGDGKGKTTASLGLALRAAGAGKKISIIQFIKGAWPSSETKSLKKFRDQIEFIQVGKGFVDILGDNKPKQAHQQAAQAGLKTAANRIANDIHQVVILDEINIAIRQGLLDVKEVITIIKKAPVEVDIVLTGRNADPKLVELADLVTEMKEIKHPFQKGARAKKGIDF